MLSKVFLTLLLVTPCYLAFSQDTTKKRITASHSNRSPVNTADTTQKLQNGDIAGYYLEEGKKKGGNGDYKGAIDDFSLVLLFKPQNTDAMYNRGLANYYLKNYDSAINDISDAILIDSTKEDYFDQRGICYSMLANYTLAKKDFDTALRLNPNSADANLNMGVLFLSAGDKDDACPYLIKAQKLGSKNAIQAYAQYCR